MHAVRRPQARDEPVRREEDCSTAPKPYGSRLDRADKFRGALRPCFIPGQSSLRRATVTEASRRRRETSRAHARVRFDSGNAAASGVNGGRSQPGWVSGSRSITHRNVGGSRASVHEADRVCSWNYDSTWVTMNQASVQCVSLRENPNCATAFLMRWARAVLVPAQRSEGLGVGQNSSIPPSRSPLSQCSQSSAVWPQPNVSRSRQGRPSAVADANPGPSPDSRSYWPPPTHGLMAIMQAHDLG